MKQSLIRCFSLKTKQIRKSPNEFSVEPIKMSSTFNQLKREKKKATWRKQNEVIDWEVTKENGLKIDRGFLFVSNEVIQCCIPTFIFK